MQTKILVVKELKELSENFESGSLNNLEKSFNNMLWIYEQ